MTIEETIRFNQAFLILYGLSPNEGAILCVLNSRNEKLTTQELVAALPILRNKKKTLQNKMNKLADKKIITQRKYTDEEVYHQLRKGNFSENSCHFCGIDDLILHSHHYPVRNKDGGTNTIKLCPNCHTRFHMIADYDKQYRFSNTYKKQWNYSEEEWNKKMPVKSYWGRSEIDAWLKDTSK